MWVGFLFYSDTQTRGLSLYLCHKILQKRPLKFTFNFRDADCHEHIDTLVSVIEPGNSHWH